MIDIYWYSVISRLREYLTTYTYDDGSHPFDYLSGYDNFKINVGTGNAGEMPRIDIILSEETPLDKEKQSKIRGATITLWLDIYVSGGVSDNNDISDYLYNQMFKAEQELYKLIHKFTGILQKDYGIAINFDVVSILSDGDMNLPTSLQHRIILDYEWRR